MGKTCCFTGHRPVKFLFKYNEQHPDCIKIKTLLDPTNRVCLLCYFCVIIKK